MLVSPFFQTDHGYRSTITSDDIEQAFLDKPDGQQAFATEGHLYVLDFKDMYQRNVQYDTKRAVCRRPVFMSKEEFQKLKQQ